MRDDSAQLAESATEVTITYETSLPGETPEPGFPEPPRHQENSPLDDEGVRLVDLPEKLIELGDVIGKGGMGVVRIARQTLPPRDVAVKRLHYSKARLARALMDEAMTIGSLEHPNIVPVHLVRLTEDNSPEVVMKYIQGRSWNEILDKQAQRGDALLVALEVLRAICHALEFAHSRGVIHRDVKPHNVMVGKFGEVYLMDWGIAIRQNEIDQVSDGLVGTPGYLAPEMLSGKARDVTFQTDVFLVGATLHTILTGRRRNDASTVVGALDAAKRSEPYSYDQHIAPALAALANHACAKERSDRLESVAEFRETIENYLALREAFAVRDRALEKKTLLEHLLARSARTKPSAIEIRQHFIEAKFGLEQALQMAPDCEGAAEGLQETTLMMIDWLLQSGHLDEADHLIANLPFADVDITSRITSLRHTATRDAAEVDYLKKIAPEYDPTESRIGRVILGATILGIVALTCIGVIIYDTLLPTVITPARLLVTTGSVALIIVAALFFARRWLFINKTGGRLASSVVFGFCCAPLFAIAGLKAGFSGNAIMVGDTLIVGLAMANAYPVVRTGRWAAGFAVANVLVAAIFPSWAHGGFMISTAFAAACIVLDWITRDFLPNA